MSRPKELIGNTAGSLGELLRKLTDQGETIFIVSHDLEFCAEYADRVGMMFDGKN